MRNKRLIALLSVVLVLVLMIITCGATFLVRNVDAYCYYETAGMKERNEKVVSIAGVKLNTSMFFVDEQGIKDKVESACPDIAVINVKRSFPDRVTINYVVYERLFQYAFDGKYYRCYSSGRIGEVADTDTSGCITVKPRGYTASVIGAYFQPSDGADRQIVDAFVKFMRKKGLNDFQMTEQVDFIDLTRNGYIYIRMIAGCSIEIKGGIEDFSRLLDRGFAVYVNGTDEKSSGLITASVNRSATATDDIRSTYVAHNAGKAYAGMNNYTDDGYYNMYYLSA